MKYPNLIDKQIEKNFDKSIMRKYIYPFSYTNNYKNYNIKHDNFIELPDFNNLILDKNGMPFIPLNK